MADYTYRIEKVEDGKVQVIYSRTGFPDYRSSVLSLYRFKTPDINMCFPPPPTAFWDRITAEANGVERDLAALKGNTYNATTP